ncbi:hypothetical protein HZS_3927 [Henneguya salminicola]|nr:hypothetical protein HZS_3927 [Henneguya salminicola]
MYKTVHLKIGLISGAVVLNSWYIYLYFQISPTIQIGSHSYNSKDIRISIWLILNGVIFIENFVSVIIYSVIYKINQEN